LLFFAAFFFFGIFGDHLLPSAVFGSAIVKGSAALVLRVDRILKAVAWLSRSPAPQ
jgi:hypothetical protein